MGAMADVILETVDRDSMGKILEMPVSDITSAMEGQSLRSLRPEPVHGFHRSFDVDIEGEVLEFVDGNAGDLEMGASPREQPMPSSELVLLLARWCSSAEWRCWDARLFLYVEPLLGREVGADEFLLPSVWGVFSESTGRTDRATYSESVVLDWMSRREALGETMEPSEDPRILPTMHSHKSLSESLFSMMENAVREGYELLVGREFLDPAEWHLGEMMISEVAGD